MKHKIITFFGIFAILLAAFAVTRPATAKPAQQDSYSQISAAPGITIDTATAAHPLLTTTAPITSLYKATHGNPKATAKVLCSNAGATVTLSCYLWADIAGTWTFLSRHDYAQMTAGSTTTETPENEGSAWYSVPIPPEWDTRGATHYEIRVTQLSAGAVSVIPWAYGAKSE